MVAVRCPSDLAPLMPQAGEPRRIGTDRGVSGHRIPQSIMCAASCDRSQRSTSDSVLVAVDMPKCCATAARGWNVADAGGASFVDRGGALRGCGHLRQRCRVSSAFAAERDQHRIRPFGEAQQLDSDAARAPGQARLKTILDERQAGGGRTAAGLGLRRIKILARDPARRRRARASVLPDLAIPAASPCKIEWHDIRWHSTDLPPALRPSFETDDRLDVGSSAVTGTRKLGDGAYLRIRGGLLTGGKTNGP
jgi:hypothetical protein